MTTKNSRTVQASKKTLRLIGALKDQESARITTLAESLNLAPSTVHSHLATLEQEGYVVKDADEYRLSLEFLDIGQQLRTRKKVYELAQEKVEQLVDETQGRAHFVVHEFGQGVYLYTRSGKHAVKAFSDPGKRFPLHVAAAGKAMLAYLPEEHIHDIIDRRGLQQETPNTITDRDKLLDELDEIRDRGAAFNREEHLQGVRAVGAPVLTDNGAVMGSFSVSGPTHRMKGEWFEQELPDLILGTANELELAITYQ